MFVVKVMATPLIMLGLLTIPCVVTTVLSRRENRTKSLRQGAAWGLGLLFLFTGVGHFLKTGEMSAMLPPQIPLRTELVVFSGVGELVLGCLFFMPRFRRAAGIAAIVLLLFLYPVNVYAASVKAPMGGHAWGLSYLWIRTPLQLLVIVWSYWFTVKKGDIS